jgi:hypothetical protein
VRKSTVSFTCGAVVLFSVAAIVRFVVLPEAAQVPSNFDVTVHYSGTASMLDPAALAPGSTAPLFVTGVPVTAAQHIKVLSTSGSTAVVSDAVTIDSATGAALNSTDDTFAVNRVTLAPASASAGSGAEAHQGLAVGFPLTPAKIDYPYWDPTTRTASPAKYVKTTTLNGRKVYVYSFASAGAVADPKTLAGLPKTLPKAALAGVEPTLPAAQKQQLAAVLPSLPTEIPLSYTSNTQITADVDTATGAVLSADENQTITADLDLGPATTPLAPVLSVSLNTTPASIASAAADASTAANLLSLLRTTIPIGAVILGMLLAAGAVWTARRHRPLKPESSPENVAESAASS